MPSNIEEQLEAARKKLLDLSMRNHLLNYRQAKARTIRVVDEVPREVYDFLVLGERAMEFRPKPEPPAPAGEAPEWPTLLEGPDDADAETPDEPEISEIWSLPTEGEGVAERHADKYLQ